MMGAAKDTRLSVVSHQRENAAILEVIGEVDLFTLPILQEAAHPILNKANHPMIVDFSRSDYIDSECIKVLISFHRHIPENHIRIVANGFVRRILEITKMDTVFRIHSDLESAIAN